MKWPIRVYVNELLIGWKHTPDDWMMLTGNVLTLIDQNIGDIVSSEIHDGIRNVIKRRNNLV
jgi:hypothetical protein